MHYILVLALSLAMPCFADSNYESYSDSGFAGPKYETLLTDMERIASQSAGVVEFLDYGKTPKGRTMRMLVASKPGSYVERPAMVMSGATHGNEFLGIEDKLPEALLKQSPGVTEFLNNGGVLIFIPVLNPDGYVARRRLNSRGVDLNRDWDLAAANFHGFKEAETRMLSDKLADLKQHMSLRYEVTVDYHCCIGALLHPWSYKDEKIPAGDLARHQEVEALASKNLGIQIGTTNEVLGYAPLGTTKDYYYATYGARAFTYEGRRNVEHRYFDQHVSWWDQLARLTSQAVPATSLLSLKWERQKFFLRLAD